MFPNDATEPNSELSRTLLGHSGEIAPGGPPERVRGGLAHLLYWEVVAPYDEFDRLMTALEDWYSDSVRARAFDADTGHASGKPGGRVLRVQRYPGPPWRRLWDEASRRADLVAQASIIRALEEELYGLDHGPSQAGPASGLHRGTAEWRKAVATADGSLRQVARRYGISHTEVRRQRLDHQEARQRQVTQSGT